MNTYISKIHQHSKYKSKPGVVGSFCDGKYVKKKKNPGYLSLFKLRRPISRGYI